MAFTIATLYRGDACETYVAVIQGGLSEADEQRIANRMDLRLEDGEALDWIGFCGVELQDPKADRMLFVNATQGDMRIYSGEDVQ